MNKKVKMSFVGDISLGDSFICQGYGVRSQIHKKGGDFIFNKVRHLFEGRDVIFGNLEAILSSTNEDKLSLQSSSLRGDIEGAYALKNVGFNVLNMANNHVMQHGAEAFEDTLSILKKLEIGSIGCTDRSWYSKPHVLRKNGIKIGFIGYAHEKDKYDVDQLIYAYGIEAQIISDISRLRTLVDILIVSNHWGSEYIEIPNRDTIKLAKKMIDNGADIIIGHHPHVVQDIEIYKNKIIAYSLGNFVFDMHWEKKLRNSMILEISFDKTSGLDFQVIPLYINKDYQPVPLLTNDNKILKNRKRNSLISSELYHSKSKKINNLFRLRSYLYFVMNFKKYKKRFIVQQIRSTLMSRYDDLFLR